MEDEVKNKSKKTPVKRRNTPGPGRPKGSSNKMTATSLLESIHLVTGKEFHVLVAEAYNKTILENQSGLRLQYEKMIIQKVMCDPKPEPNASEEEQMANKTTSELIEIANSLVKKLQ